MKVMEGMSLTERLRTWAHEWSIRSDDRGLATRELTEAADEIDRLRDKLFNGAPCEFNDLPKYQFDVCRDCDERDNELCSVDGTEIDA